MRINSISVAQPKNLNYKMRAKRVQAQPVTMQTQEVPFKGLKAGFFGIVGTVLAGGAAAIATGGALLPVLLASAAGTTGGCIYGSSKEDGHDDDYDYDPCYPNCRDY